MRLYQILEQETKLNLQKAYTISQQRSVPIFHDQRARVSISLATIATSYMRPKLPQ